ncbi:uncharacterized protein [Euwallacea similis]|uniref:uncharacterized protein n=1 Tax=Euwallacea similis TaxID=1736056 RepID=UPI00344DF94C
MGYNPLSIMTSTPLKTDNYSSFDPSISMLSSIKPSQNPVPGSAQKLLDRKLAHLEGGLNSTLSSVKDQSSCQMVLNSGNLAPVHRNPIMRNQTPPSAFNFMRKYRGNFQNSSSGIPRK